MAKTNPDSTSVDRDHDGYEQLASILEERFGERLDATLAPGDAGRLLTLAEHRTCRNFADQPVDANLLRLVCACALSAPSKSDLQQGELIEVTDPDDRARIVELLPSMEWVASAPRFLVICGNNRRLRQMSEMHGYTFANDHLDAFFNAAFDAGILLSNLIIAANAVGLRTCPISVIRNHCDTINDILRLPDHVFPTAGLCIGWPAENGRISSRLSLNSTIHHGQHDDADWQEQIRDYDVRRGRRDGWDPADPKFKGWSHQKARMYSETQRDDFGDYIKKKGFNLI